MASSSPENSSHEMTLSEARALLGVKAAASAVEIRTAFRAKAKLAMPVLALGGEKSYGDKMAVELADVATNVKAGVIPASGHWIMEENPDATTNW